MRYVKGKLEDLNDDVEDSEIYTNEPEWIDDYYYNQIDNDDEDDDEPHIRRNDNRGEKLIANLYGKQTRLSDQSKELDVVEKHIHDKQKKGK